MVYRRGRPFGEYVDYFWDIRRKAMEEGDETMKWFAKLLQNSFYGKWGQLNPVYDVTKAEPGELSGITTVVSTASGRRASRLVFGGKVWMLNGEAPARFTSVSLASWISSYGRVKLWKLAQQASLDHVYYCDTDSLFVDQTGYERLSSEIVPNTLGMLEVKKKGQSLTIKGLKDYTLDGDIAIKGVPKKRHHFSSEEARAYLEKKGHDEEYILEHLEDVYSYMTFDRFRTRLRKGAPDMIQQR
ncbi:unnamed protein product, partial [marine sediment metagenome]